MHDRAGMPRTAEPRLQLTAAGAIVTAAAAEAARPKQNDIRSEDRRRINMGGTSGVPAACARAGGHEEALPTFQALPMGCRRG